MGRRIRVMTLVISASLAAAGIACAQAPAGAGNRSGPAGPLGGVRNVEKTTWNIFGRVTAINGDPVGDCTVTVRVGGGRALERTTEPNLQGEFHTGFSLDASTYKSLAVEVVAHKSGYQDARENVDFGSSDNTWNIDLVLRPATPETNLISESELMTMLAPRLRRAPEQGSMKAPALKEYDRGASELLDKSDPLRALRTLARLIDREPACISCRILLGLARLRAGGLNGAAREFAEAAKLNSDAPEGARRAEPLLLLGVLEEWKGENQKAAGWFLQALQVNPADPLALQEIGRTQFLLRNWEAADQYVQQAIKLGAPPGARLMSIRVLMEEGEIERAEAEMQKYLAGRQVKDFPVPIRGLYTQIQDRLQLQAYGKVRSVVAQPVSELIKAAPELNGIEAASSQERLPEILRKLGSNVEAFFRSFPDTVSMEQIQQQSFRRDGKVTGSLEQRFRYLLLTRPEQHRLGLEEYRADAAGSRTAPGGLKEGFMLTTGFASAALIFHPDYQPGAEFRYLGSQKLNGRSTEVIAFAQQPDGARMIERFNAGSSSVLILIQGIAWVDSASGEPLRMRTDLLKPQPEIRLDKQTTEIEFGEVRFKGVPGLFWLPRQVVVTVEWRGKKYRNLHAYSEFKLFNVGTEEKRKAV